MKKITTLVLCLLLASGTMAQLKKSRIGNNSNQHISLGIGASYPVFDYNGAIGGAAQLSYTYYFMPRLGLRGEVGYAYLRYQPKGTLTGSTNERDGLHTGDLSAQVVFNYFIDRGQRRENNRGSAVPERAYLYAGVGCFFYDTHASGTNGVGVHANFPIGTGVAWSVGANWAIGIDATWRFTLTDNIDAVTPEEFMPDCYATLCLSVTYKIPKQRIGSKETRIRTQRNKACDPRKGCDFTFF